MADETQVLAELIAGPVAAVSFDTGTVAAAVDASHVLVDLGERTVTVFVPATLAGAAGVGAFVRVQVQENSYLLDSVLSGGSAGLVPVGTVIMWLGSSVPAGWLKLDGSTYSSSTYPLLYAHLGSTTLPDWRDRVPMGASGTKSAKSTGGNASLTLGANELPSHTHTVSNIGIGAVKEPASGTNVNVYYPSGGTSNVSNTGTGASFSILNPYLATHYLIKAA